MNKSATITLNAAIGLGIALALIVATLIIFWPTIKSLYSDNSNKQIDTSKVNPVEIPSYILTENQKYETSINNAVSNIKEDREHAKIEKNFIIALIAKTSKADFKFISDCGSAGLIPILPLTGAIYSLKIFEDSRLADCQNKEINLEYANDLRSNITNKNNEEIKQIDERFDPEKNINTGTQYLSQLLKKYNSDEKLTLIAYYKDPSYVEENCRENSNECLNKDQEIKNFVIAVLAYKSYLNQNVISQISEDEQKARARLNALSNNHISVNKESCKINQKSDCTNIAGLPENAINELVDLTKKCNCNIIITGGTEEAQHETHGPGKPIVDLGKNSNLDSYIRKNALKTEIVEVQKARYKLYYVNGNKYLDEVDHWHVVFGSYA